MRRIKISEKDKKNLKPQKKDSLSKEDFSGKVVNKPWGYEYLMFSTPEVSIWMLYLKKGHSTSMHCHPKKKTSLSILLGKAKCNTLNKEFQLKEKQGIIYDKGVFHKTEAISEDGLFMMETETPTDKTDLFRLKDKYHREKKGYTYKKNITDKTYNYHYLSLKNNIDSENNLGKYSYIVKNVKDINELKKFDFAILLSGRIGNINQGEIVYPTDIKKNIRYPIKILLIREKKLIKLSDYVMTFLEKNGIKDIFLVSGGNLMYLLESLRVNKKINYVCNHHEQASAMAAEGYAKMTNKIGVAMVTSGPGGTNTLTGVVGAWIDSNPMLIISGQSYSTQTIGKSGLRQLGVQETNIIDIVKPITKYAVMVKDPKNIKHYLEKAFHLATTGRPGPVWIDIPINIQMAQFEEEDLK